MRTKKQYYKTVLLQQNDLFIVLNTKIMSNPKFNYIIMLKFKFVIVNLLMLLLIISCSDNENNTNISQTDDTVIQVINPLFQNSIVSTNIDFIKDSDPNAFSSIQYIGQEVKEMPDSRTDILLDISTYVFEVSFISGDTIEIWAHSTFGDEFAAQEYADKLTSRLGKLPEFIRNIISHVVLHKGNEGAFAESEGHFFVLYSDNMDVRISNNDLEETVFHESIHAALDFEYLQSSQWWQAQQNDDAFITQYAKDNPSKEDMAESALFAYTMIKYSDRLSSEIQNWVNTNIPNRYAFFESIFE